MDFFDLRVGKLVFHADSYVDDDFIFSVIESRLDDHYSFLCSKYEEVSLTWKLVDFSVINISCQEVEGKKLYFYNVRFYYEVICE